MNCPKCQTKNLKTAESCTSCGLDLNKVREARAADPSVVKMVAWSLVAMGILGLIFVIVNSGQDWHTWLDYVGPVALLLVGGGALLSQGMKK